MLVNLLANFAGVMFFLFIFWFRLKEDFIANQIFGSAFIILTSVVVGRIFANLVLSNYWFWLDIISISLGFVLAISRFRIRLLEAAEAVIIGLLPWLSIYFLIDFVIESKLSSLIGSAVLLVLIILFFIVDKHYKRFSWYKSGSVGFSGFSTLGLFFLIRAAVALFADGVLSFSGNYEVYVSAVFAFLSFLVVFNQART